MFRPVQSCLFIKKISNYIICNMMYPPEIRGALTVSKIVTAVTTRPEILHYPSLFVNMIYGIYGELIQ